MCFTDSDYTPPPVQALLECHASDDKELGLIELALSNEPKLHSLKVLGMDSKKRVRKRCKGCYQELVMKGGPAYARVKAPLVNTICETCNIPLCSLCFQTHAETLWTIPYLKTLCVWPALLQMQKLSQVFPNVLCNSTVSINISFVDSCYRRKLQKNTVQLHLICF